MTELEVTAENFDYPGYGSYAIDIPLNTRISLNVPQSNSPPKQVASFIIETKEERGEHVIYLKLTTPSPIHGFRKGKVMYFRNGELVEMHQF